MTENNNKLTVFLPWTTVDIEKRNDLKNILLNAGCEVLPIGDKPDSELDFIEEVKDAVAESECSLFFLGSRYDESMKIDETLSISKYQFLESQKKLKKSDDFKIFIWYPDYLVDVEKDEKQEQFINNIRYNILDNMVFSNINSPIQLVDDMRSMMEKDETFNFDINDTEIFIMFNELDEFEASDIVDMLGDIVDVEKLNIIQDENTEYLEFCAQQIERSKLAVIYFKETAEWALPFVQQVWKKVGGASSHTPILLVGDEDPETNKGKVFNAPKVVSLIVSGELIPLEIKVQLDKLKQ
jgi:hypothetical protein